MLATGDSTVKTCVLFVQGQVTPGSFGMEFSLVSQVPLRILKKTPFFVFFVGGGGGGGGEAVGIVCFLFFVGGFLFFFYNSKKKPQKQQNLFLKKTVYITLSLSFWNSEL